MDGLTSRLKRILGAIRHMYILHTKDDTILTDEIWNKIINKINIKEQVIHSEGNRLNPNWRNNGSTDILAYHLLYEADYPLIYNTDTEEVLEIKDL